MSKPATDSWQIETGRVGTLRLGEPIPAALLADESALRAGYVARFVADAQPFEGFRLQDPPVTVALAQGPLTTLVDERGVVDELPVQELSRAAIRHASSGGRVMALLVHARGPATAENVGVGSTLPDLRRSYETIRVRPMPPTLGEDRCLATAKALPGVRFLFSSCEAAEEGAPVRRVDLWLDED